MQLCERWQVVMSCFDGGWIVGGEEKNVGMES